MHGLVGGTVFHISTVIPMNNACFLSLLHACKENHPDVISVLGWQIILGTRAAFASKKTIKDLGCISLPSRCDKVLFFSVCFLTASLTLTLQWISSPRNSWGPASSLQRILRGLGEGGWHPLVLFNVYHDWEGQHLFWVWLELHLNRGKNF